MTTTLNWINRPSLSVHLPIFTLHPTYKNNNTGRAIHKNTNIQAIIPPQVTLQFLPQYFQGLRNAEIRETLTHINPRVSGKCDR